MQIMKNKGFLDWINRRSIFYLQENLGPIESEIREKFNVSFSQGKIDLEIYEQVLPLSFAHLRLLSGLTFDAVFQDLHHLRNLYHDNSPEIQPGTLYLLLTSLSSTPGKLSSLALGRDAFFSLLTVRLATQDLNKEQMKNELRDFWKIEDPDAVRFSIDRAKNFSIRLQRLNRGLEPLPGNIYDPIASIFPKFSSSDFSGYTDNCEHIDFEELAKRVHVLDYVKNNLHSIKERKKITSVINSCDQITRSMGGFFDGVLPWEKELITWFPPIFHSILSWASRLRLLDDGETPIAYPGRERLPDWIAELFKDQIRLNEVSELFRFFVGIDTYLIVGIHANSKSKFTNVRFHSPQFETDTKFILRLVFGGEFERQIVFDLNQRRELLCAINLLKQRDIRLDIFVQDEGGNLRFGVSRYLEDFQQNIQELKIIVSSYVFKNFDGNEDDIKISILEELSG
ncbi:MAG: hypothetical protein VX794_05575 [Nitrospinota bacterium]|nr:hypothetical protein [Nitrospinota bacterium]